MIYVLIPALLLAGAGVGFGGGIWFARQDQGKVFDLMTATVDKLTASALFPGLKGVVPQAEVPDQMFDTSDIDEAAIPAFLREESDNPWDYTDATQAQ